MSILSLQYILFISVLLLLYFKVPKKIQWIILLIGNMFFYAINSWKCLYFIIITVVSQYAIARILDNINAQQNKKIEVENISGKEKSVIKKEYASKKKKYLVLSICINLGLLIFIKYTNIFIDEISKILALFEGEKIEHINILIPVGLSYYTFSSLGYVIDVYRGKQEAEKNIFKFALFVSFFPTMVQGPIHRYKDLAEQLQEEHQFDYQRICFAAQRMIWGYFKKLVIAERLGVVVDTVYNNADQGTYLGLYVVMAAVLYGFQIYADFSGGMDIVIAVGEAFGITMTENFQRPYMAKTYSEFWRRWHITLGAWFKNYVFYPLSLSKLFNNFSKKCSKLFGKKAAKVLPPSLASFFTFLLIGLWHGTGWKYFVYGLYAAIMVSQSSLLEDVYTKLKVKFKIDEERIDWKVFQVGRTLFFVTISRIISRAKDLTQVKYLFKNMFSQFNPWILFDGSLYQLGLDEKDFRLMLMSLVVLCFVDILQERGIHIRETIAKQNILFRWTIYYAAVTSVIIFGRYGTGYDAANFIYMR